MERKPEVDLYGATYGGFATDVYGRVRARAFGEDLGQSSWLTADELARFTDRLRIGADGRLLDVACGSGGTALRIAATTGCAVQGVDLHADAVRQARAQAQECGMAERARFELADASRPLPFPDGAFDGLICVDAVNHLPDRRAVLQEWARLLRPGGRLVFTDPTVVTGPLSSEEIAVRASIGFFLFVPAGLDERLLAEAGFRAITAEDRTDNMARVAARWRAARETCAAELREVEGEEAFAGQQRFLGITARLAGERRLSRTAFSALRA